MRRRLKDNIKRAVAAFCVIACSGCATSPVPDGDAEVVQTPAFAQSAVANTLIVVTRDRGLANGGATARVFVDGREAAILRPSQQAQLHVAAGEHVVAVGQNSSNVQAASETTTKAERERRFRISAEPGRFWLIPQ